MGTTESTESDDEEKVSIEDIKPVIVGNKIVLSTERVKFKKKDDTSYFAMPSAAAQCAEVAVNRIDQRKIVNRSDILPPIRFRDVMLDYIGFNIKSYMAEQYSYHWNALKSIGLLRMKFSDECYVGSGCVFDSPVTNIKQHFWVITAAHNVVDVDPLKSVDIKPEYPSAVWFERRNNRTGLEQRYSVVEYYIHPKYVSNATPQSGYDLAILKVNNIDSHPFTAFPFKFCSDVRRFEYRSQQVYLGGFPGEKKGKLWGMSGKFDGETHEEVIQYNEIDTSGGQSGSPILCEGPYLPAIIGVHTGGYPMKKRNFGTKLTPDKLEWIGQTTGDTYFPNYTYCPNFERDFQTYYQCNQSS